MGILVEMFNGSKIDSSDSNLNFFPLTKGDPVVVLAYNDSDYFNYFTEPEFKTGTSVFVGEVDECDGRSFMARDAYARLCDLKDYPSLNVNLEHQFLEAKFNNTNKPLGRNALNVLTRSKIRYRVYGVEYREELGI